MKGINNNEIYCCKIKLKQNMSIINFLNLSSDIVQYFLKICSLPVSRVSYPEYISPGDIQQSSHNTYSLPISRVSYPEYISPGNIQQSSHHQVQGHHHLAGGLDTSSIDMENISSTHDLP